MNLQIERDSVVVLQGVFVEGDGARRALKVRIGDGNRLLLGRIDDFEFEQLVDPGDVDRSFLPVAAEVISAYPSILSPSRVTMKPPSVINEW